MEILEGLWCGLGSVALSGLLLAALLLTIFFAFFVFGLFFLDCFRILVLATFSGLRSSRQTKPPPKACVPLRATSKRP